MAFRLACLPAGGGAISEVVLGRSEAVGGAMRSPTPAVPRVCLPSVTTCQVDKFLAARVAASGDGKEEFGTSQVRLRPPHRLTLGTCAVPTAAAADCNR